MTHKNELTPDYIMKYNLCIISMGKPLEIADLLPNSILLVVLMISSGLAAVSRKAGLT